MKMPNRLAATTTCYAPYSLEEALAGMAGAGFRYVELASIRGIMEHVPLDADSRELGGVQRLLNRYTLTPVALSAHSNLQTSKGLKDALRALDLCERLGIEIMNTAVGGAEDGPEDETAFLKNIGGISDYAAERQITVTLEIHGDLTATGRKAASLINKVKRPNIRINYDTANCEYFGNFRADVDLPYAVRSLGLVHLKDKIGGERVWNFPALGKGHVDFTTVIRLLKRARYKGPCSVEVEFRGNPWPPVAAVNRALKASYRYLRRLGLS
jgi:sugar phosphate isomerase/epimerase